MGYRSTIAIASHGLPPCVECGKPIKGRLLEFAGPGRFVCEPCLRRYYRAYPKDKIEREIQCRARLVQGGGALRG